MWKWNCRFKIHGDMWWTGYKIIKIAQGISEQTVNNKLDLVNLYIVFQFLMIQGVLLQKRIKPTRSANAKL